MNKKSLLFFSILLFSLSASLQAQPAEGDVKDTFEGVFSLYSMVFVGALMEMDMPGVTLEVAPDGEGSAVLFHDMDVNRFLTALGDSKAFPGMEEFPTTLPFSGISGQFSTFNEDKISMKVQLIGGPITELEMEYSYGEILRLEADGIPFTHLAKKWEEEE
ncbi:MAG: hypothetical protein MI717_03655 [Spirochaetales bacterium]|nr:hypothetical protein [Spirochaetales bacterium]